MKRTTLLFAIICPALLEAQDSIPPTIGFDNGLDTFLLDVYDAYSEDVHLSDNATSQSYLQNSLRLSGSYVKRFPNGPSDTLGLFYCDYTLKDSAGNSASQRRWIKVVDREAPVLEMDNWVIVHRFDETPQPLNISAIEYSVNDNYYKPDEIEVRIDSSDVKDSVFGTYDLTFFLTDLSNNQTSYDIEVVVAPDFPWGNTKNPEVQKSIVYPNPTTGVVYLDDDNRLRSYSIHNQQGQLVKQVFTPENQIDLSVLPRGTYILRLVFDEHTMVQQIVKQ